MKIEKKNEERRRIIGCQTIRRKEGKMKSQGEGRGGEGRRQNVFTVGIALA